MPSGNSSSNKHVPHIFQYDEDLRRKHPLIAGLDEAGRGPLAGPVVAAAVVLPSGIAIEGLRDSKKVAEKERKWIFWQVVQKALAVGVGIINADVIDKINILQATKRAMKAAIQDLGIKPDILLIDAVKLPDVHIQQHSMYKGESVSASIAAASIVAKTVRDDIMVDYHEKFPVYNFKGHKGYSTKEHMERIQVHGPCPVHRRSFRKVTDIQLHLGWEGQ